MIIAPTESGEKPKPEIYVVPDFDPAQAFIDFHVRVQTKAEATHSAVKAIEHDLVARNFE